MLSLNGCLVGEDGAVTATYVATHKPTGKDAAAVNGTVTLQATFDGAKAMLEIEPAAADTEEGAFDHLADMLESMAKAIRDRGQPKLGVPVYG